MGLAQLAHLWNVLGSEKFWKKMKAGSKGPHLNTGSKLDKTFTPKHFSACNLNSYLRHIEEPDVGLLDSYSKEKKKPLALNLTQ